MLAAVTSKVNGVTPLPTKPVRAVVASTPAAFKTPDWVPVLSINRAEPSNDLWIFTSVPAESTTTSNEASA